MLQKASRAHFWKEAEGRGSWSFVSFWGQKLQILDGNQAWEWTHWAGGFVGSDQSRNLWSIGCWRQLLATDGWYGARSRRWGTVYSCLSSNMKAHCAKMWSMKLRVKCRKRLILVLVLVAPGWQQFDWEGDFPPGLHQKDLVIYEMHIRGFTRHTSSKVEHSGTYLGLVEKLSHLKVHFLLQSSSLVMDDVVILTMSNSLLFHVSNL